MTKDEEMEQLRQENTALRDQVARLSERISVLEAQLAKDSHNSHLPTSADRFHRQPKSLRKRSGAQARHGGADRSGTGLDRPSCFSCFLAHLKSYGENTLIPLHEVI